MDLEVRLSKFEEEKSALISDANGRISRLKNELIEG
jgi:hypothetical protein